MPLATTSVINWLTNLGWDVTQESGAPIVPGPYVLQEPDRIVVVSPTPGPGYILEGDADVSAFQARVRGSQNDQADAETLAYLLDSLILRATFPVTIDGRVLIHVHRLGGTPSPLAAGPDPGDRYEYICSYLCFAAT
jgi:hypothetical protein